MTSYRVKSTFYLTAWSRQQRKHVKRGPRQRTLHRTSTPSVIRREPFALSNMISNQEWKADLRETQSVSLPLSSCLVGWLVLGLYGQLTKCWDGRAPISVYSSLPTFRKVTMGEGLVQSPSYCCLYRLLVFEQTQNTGRRQTYLPCLS